MKRFVTLMWVILISIMNYAQTPQVSIPITINDGAGGSQVLYFGLDPAATDGIDVGLGEAVLPPLPPTGVFDARLNLPNGTESSLRDYRQGSNSYSGSESYKLQYQVGTGSVINIVWNFMPGVTGRLQDVILGNIIDVNMSGSGSYQVTNLALNQLNMTITYTPPTLNLPANGATNQWLTTTFTWNSVTNATKYGLYVATNSDFSNIVFSDTTITGTSKTLTSALNTYTIYYWRIIGISENGRAIYSETRSFTTAKPIFWANLQWPDQATIEVGGSMTAYAQIWIDGITAGAGPGSGISAWIGYSTSNTNPNTWTNWVPATYNVNVGDNDEYMASIGSDLPAGTYYFASRFQFAGGAYYYGGFNNGEWNGTTNISGVLTITTPLPGIPNPLTPGNGSTGIGISPMFIWNTAANATLYRLQIATDAGFSNIVFNDSTITDSTYTLTTELNYNTQYFWRINAKNAAGTSNFSGTQSFTTVRGIGWANLQFPPSAEISVGGNATFYARVYVSGITEPAGQGSNIEGWIGYSTTNTDPSTWTDWVPATYNADYDNNDEYMATFGSTLPAGTYYVASKFRYLSTEGGPPNKYGGYSEGGGGFWDGVNNISSVLTVTSAVPPAAPTLVSPVNGATAQSTLPTLEWNASSGATSYRLIIATDAEFSDIVYNDSTITDTSKTLTSALQNYKTYYWKVSAKSAGGTSAYSVAWNFRTIAVIGWANFQAPNTLTLNVGSGDIFYARVYAQNITDAAGQGSGISAWIGYSTTNTDPSTWTEWVPATYINDQGNNDQYRAYLGNTLPVGTYYIASRFALSVTDGGPAYVYGGYSSGGGGFWNGTTYISGVLTIRLPIPSTPSLTAPVYNATGVSTLPTFTWTSVSYAETYRLQVATDQNFTNIIFDDSTLTATSKTLTSALENNRLYYWRVNAKNASGTSSYTGAYKFTTEAAIGWANLQHPSSTVINTGGSATFYSRVYAQNITEATGQGAGITGWIGYSTTNTNPNTWTNWVPATYNTDQGNNDEYQAIIGSTLSAGTYYVASRFQLGSGSYVYGGYSIGGGGYWDGTNYISATLTISLQAPEAPTLVTPVNNATGVGTLPTLTWNASANATSYRLIISTKADFTDVVYNDSTITDTSKTLTSALQNNKQYYWKVNAKNGSGTSSYSTTWNFTTVAVIGWANLQFPGSASIDLGGSATYYSRVYAQNITEPSGQGAGITAWIGYSTTNTNPNTWTNWVPATYNTDQGNNDEYQAVLGSTLPSGTYYVASRFQLGSTEIPANYVYGGYSTDGGGYWDGTNYVSATLSVSVPAPSAPTLVSPLNNSTGISTLPTLTWNASANATSYRLIIATKADFTDVVYNDSTITDTSKTLTSALLNNKQYYWKVNAKNGSGTSSYSTTWNFTTVAVIGWANLQWPPNANISSDSSVTVYARIWVYGITDQPGAGPGILGWIGYSTTNSNPANWTNWIPAVYNVDAGNDDEYMAAIGNNLPAGTYYYASRFNLNSGEYKYGGYNEAGGGFWDSTNNVSGVLVVNSPLPTAPEQLLPLNNSYNQTLTLQFKWSSVPSAINYRLQVATDQGFANVIYNDSTLTDTTVTLSNVLLNSTIYYWRVRAKNISGNGPFSVIWNFKTISEIPIISNLWQLNSGNGTLPGWFSTNNTERGIAFGSTNSKLESDDRLFITSTNGGIFIRILNASNGAEVGSLNNTGITGGALPISDVETTADGKILVCNLTENASLSPFKIYLWNSETSVPSNIINWLSSDAVKLGDKFTVTGSYSDNSAVIYAASETNGINKLYKWTMSGGAFTNNPTIINLTGVEEVPAPSASVGPLPNGDFYWKASMMKLRKYTSTGSLIDTIPSAVVPLQGNAVRYVGKVNNKEYAVIFQYGNINENARIIEVSDNNYSQAISLETTPTLGMNPNIYGFGDVTVRINQNGSADIYVLSTNNGIGRYQTIQPIPVELSSFNAIANGDNVTLHWSTATESNSREFIIERMDGKDTEWKIIGKVDAKGSSVSQTDYSYKDEHLMEGIHEYRLKMVDVDGTFSYSQVINVETGNPTSYLLMQNYPNPFNPSTSISYQLSENSKVRLTIYDITGREIAILIDKQQDAGYYRIDFNASNLTSGIYFYELIAGDFRDVKKLVLMK